MCKLNTNNSAFIESLKFIALKYDLVRTKTSMGLRVDHCSGSGNKTEMKRL